MRGEPGTSKSVFSHAEEDRPRRRAGPGCRSFRSHHPAYCCRPMPNAACGEQGLHGEPDYGATIARHRCRPSVDPPNLSQGDVLESAMIPVTCGAGRVRLGWARIGMISSNMECPRCHGSGRVFDCSKWYASNGHCCPHGTHRGGCPGKTGACAECDGLGTMAEPPLRAVA